MPTAIFRADATRATGGGHVVRCLSLADELAAHGWTCAFLTSAETRNVAAGVAAGPHALLELPTGAEHDPAAAASLLPADVDLLVFDHYRLSASYERALGGSAGLVVCIDDLADRARWGDMVVDATPGRRPADYAGLLPDGAQLLLGPSYALVRPDFPRNRDEALRRRGSVFVDRILVSFGSVDSRDATGLALEALALAAPRLIRRPAVDVVLGSSSLHLERVRGRIDGHPLAPRLHVATGDMASLMRDADLALGAPGTTSLERCCLGLPSLLVAVADNQLRWGAELDERGAARFLGSTDDVTAEEFADAIVQHAADGLWREQAAAASASLCDGLGPARLRAAIERGPAVVTR